MNQNSIKSKNLTFIYPVIVITLCAAFQFYKYVLQVYPSIITGQLMQEYQLTGAGLGNLAATFYYTFMIAQLFVGMLLDRFGARWVAATAILFCAVGVFIFSQTHSLPFAWLGRGLIGIGVAFSTVTYMKLAAVWFSPKRYAFVSGLLATATMAGAVFGEVPLSFFMNHLGWRHCLSLVSVPGFILAFLFVLLIRERSTNNEKTTPISFKDIVGVLKNKKNWLLTCYAGLAFSPISVFAGLWGNPFLQQAYHLDKAQGAYMLSFVFFGLGLGSPLLGVLSAYVKDRCNMMFYCTLIACAAISLVLYHCTMPNWMLASCLFTFGFALGAFMVSFTLGKELNSIMMTATVIAMINAGDAVLTAITEPVVGKLLDLGWAGAMVDGVRSFSTQDYRIALTILPVYLLAAAFVILKVKQALSPTVVQVAELQEKKSNLRLLLE